MSAIEEYRAAAEELEYASGAAATRQGSMKEAREARRRLDDAVRALMAEGWVCGNRELAAELLPKESS